MRRRIQGQEAADRDRVVGLALHDILIEIDDPERRKRPVVVVDGENVLVPGDRPKGSVAAPRGVVDWIFFAQPLEIGPMFVAVEQHRIDKVDLIERDGIGIARRRYS
ncbi:MAG TPA: hypothetical protein VJ859_02325 [Allosphingosinicella sp.]|nr:hypothetical protein [Allosphingosinicella sp.]